MKKKIFVQELKKLDLAGLIQALHKAQQNLFTIRLNAKTGNVKNTASMPLARKNVAQVQTIINEKINNRQL